MAISSRSGGGVDERQQWRRGVESELGRFFQFRDFLLFEVSDYFCFFIFFIFLFIPNPELRFIKRNSV